MTFREEPVTAIAAVLASTRGVLDAHDVTGAIIGLLALRRASGESLARIAAVHDPERALDQTLNRIEAQQPELGEAIGTLLAAVRRDRAALPILLRSVDAVSDESRTNLFVALSKLFAVGAKKGGVAITAPNVMRLMARIAVETKEARVCDPFCGVGLLLASVAVADDLRPALLQGWERNVGAVALARAVYSALDVHARIGVANALVAPPSDDLYDAVISAPPFGAQPPPHLQLDASSRFRFGVPARHADWLFAQHALSALAPGGTAVILMTRGPLFRSGSELEVRRGLVDSDILDSVISLPAGILPGTMIPSCLVVLRRDRPSARRGAVLFVDVPNRDPASGDIPSSAVDAFARAYRAGANSDDGVGVRRATVAEIAAMDYSLDPARYLAARPEEPERPLKDVVAELRKARAHRDAASERLARAFHSLLVNEHR